MIEINVAKDFSVCPGGRYVSDGPNSGEQFRKMLLKPAYIKAQENKEKILINFDGCFGIPISFIDESFGGLSRELHNPNILSDMIIISTEQPNLLRDCISCMYIT